jgi:hypothetical protein
MKTERHHRWLRWKRHLRSCAVSDRALRDADRALAAAAANAAAVALATPIPRGFLCRSADRLAA